MLSGLNLSHFDPKGQGVYNACGKYETTTFGQNTIYSRH